MFSEGKSKQFGTVTMSWCTGIMQGLSSLFKRWQGKTKHVPGKDSEIEQDKTLKKELKVLAELYRKFDSFRKCEEYQQWLSLRKLRILLYSYRYNFARIKKSLVFYQDVHHDDPVKFWSEGSVRRNFQRRFSSDLLNYLASVAVADLKNEKEVNGIEIVLPFPHYLPRYLTRILMILDQE